MASCQYETEIRTAAARYGIDPNIGVRQFIQENGCKPVGCSSAGACGIAQFIPGTAARYGVTDRSNVAQSLDGWGRYMRDLLNMFGGRYDLALAGYNWGEFRPVLKQALAEGKPATAYNLPAETRNYINSILGGVSTASPGATGATTSILQTGLFSGISPAIVITGVLAIVFLLRR